MSQENRHFARYILLDIEVCVPGFAFYKLERLLNVSYSLRIYNGHDQILRVLDITNRPTLLAAARIDILIQPNLNYGSLFVTVLDRNRSSAFIAV